MLVQGPQNYSDALKSAVSLLQRPLITEFHKFQPYKFDDTKKIGRKTFKKYQKTPENYYYAHSGPIKGLIDTVHALN